MFQCLLHENGQLMALCWVRVKGVDGMTTEYLLAKEVDRVLAALMPQNQLIVRLMLQTGMRVGDAVAWPTRALKPSGW